jgi:FMN-dependent oxidoreductase (nitrilotriacetate monooxygenase family)
MSNQKRMMRIGLNLVQNGTHQSGWRHPDANAGVANDFEAYVELVRAAERQKLHFLFLADGAGVRIDAKDNEQLSYHGHIDRFEPLTLVSALSALTRHIGFVCTASTTYNEPYALARRFASIDHISHGRVGWNVVTGWSEEEARNFGHSTLMEHDRRYERAAEFVEVVTGLWDSWDDDAFIRDKASGHYFDPDKLHVLNHKGAHYDVRGPLNISRAPQGHPVIAQAGGSGPGRDLGARIADIIYTSQTDLAEAQDFYKDMKARAAKAGRDPDTLLVMPGWMPILGSTDEEAHKKFDVLDALNHPQIQMAGMTRLLGDLSNYDIDDYMPLPLPPSNAVQSTRDRLEKRLREKPMTIREVCALMSSSFAHRAACGSIQTVADRMQLWFESGACDGFNLSAAYMSGPVFDFIDNLVPELRRRGVFRAEYQGSTLRENLGLPRKPNQFTAKAKGAQGVAAE